ncbi:MAG: division/cell wall cluster transcriptional repressor MraZ [Candidatus Solincola sediminis]|uniref:Transcriptional regulator MraZ n=1 Tax=Candidatus Solincola sediminis TaxID=1797199 RepID=A0A1F2WS11_9ACTN|nr:MAG: division/cell wall cluster transcriptional repressor MraZ [Candidatus Solincola sediminis]
MFLGSHEHSLDDKGRIIMPSKFRRQLEEGVVMVLWLEECLAVFPSGEFEKLAERIEALPQGSKEGRTMTRILFGHAFEAVPDRQGRLTIPPKLRELAGLDREVVAVGVKNRVEIWDRNRWQDSMEGDIEKYEQVAEKLSEIGF